MHLEDMLTSGPPKVFISLLSYFNKTQLTVRFCSDISHESSGGSSGCNHVCVLRINHVALGLGLGSLLILSDLQGWFLTYSINFKISCLLEIYHLNNKD